MKSLTKDCRSSNVLDKYIVPFPNNKLFVNYICFIHITLMEIKCQL